ncbi:hypothetical protein ACFVTY_23365 [Streptomyces sp. NPDC058067]|uniref:hypothetical protein n=1 Tax=Streptomyces sp. NPDC058067 TaxID=3346324 RepID=UPI0036E2E3C4
MPQSGSGGGAAELAPHLAQVLLDEVIEVAAGGECSAADAVGEGERIDRAVQELAGDRGDHGGGPQVGGENALAHDQLLAVQGIDQSPCGVRARDELVAGDPLAFTVEVGVDQAGSADEPSLGRGGCNAASVCPGPALVVDVAERQGDAAPALAPWLAGSSTLCGFPHRFCPLSSPAVVPVAASSQPSLTTGLRSGGDPGAGDFPLTL